MITAIVNPSNDIAHGYDGAEITLHDGRKIHGIVLSGGNPLIIQSTGGVTQMIPAALVKERKRLGRSLMLSAEQFGLTRAAGGGHRRLPEDKWGHSSFRCHICFRGLPSGASVCWRPSWMALRAAQSGVPNGD